MHRNMDVTLGENRYTNHSDLVPEIIFALTSDTLTLLNRIAKLPVRAIGLIQDNHG